MSRRMASDEVTDEIAAIEMHRQGTEQESGLAVACTEALRKLQVLLEQEKEALRLHGPDSVHGINVDVVADEVKRIQSMGGSKSHGAMPRNARPRGQPPAARPEKPRGNVPRNRGRRPLGRSGRGGGRGGGGSGGGAGGAGGGGNGNGNGPGPGMN